MAFTQRGQMEMMRMKAKRWGLTDEDKALAIAAIREGLKSDRARTRGAAMRLMLAMEKQNQIDDLNETEAAPHKVIVEFVEPTKIGDEE